MTLRLRREDAPLLATVVAGVLVRAAYLRELRAAPAFLQPVLDGAAHLEWARGLLAGTWPPPEAFFRAPGYVAWLAAELAALGGDPIRAETAQLFLGVGTALLTAILARRLFGTAAAWVAGLGAAAYPMFAFFDAQLLSPFLELPLALAATLATLAARERPGFARAAGAGLLWSAAAVVRPPLLLAGLVLPAALLAGSGPRGPRLRNAAFALAGLLLLPLALTARNAAVGDPVFLASQGGLNFYLGNNARANGMAATFPDDPTALGYRMMDSARAIAERASGRPLRSAEVSAYWRERTLGDVARDPGRWLALLLKKAVLFWGSREIPNNHDPVLVAESAPLLRFLPGWIVWAPLGLVGIALGWRRREVRVLAGVILAVAAAAVLFFVNARFRLPAAPFLIVLGSGAAVEIARGIPAWRGRALAGAGAALVLAGLVRWNPYGVPREPWLTSYLLVAEAETARGEPVRALRWIERALAVEPNLYAARVAQIDLLRRSGRIPEALAIAERAVRALPDDPALRSAYGALLDLSGRPEEALGQLDAALARDPGYDPARVSRAVVLARLGRKDEAMDALRAFLAGNPRSAEAPRAARVLHAIESGDLEAAEGR